MKLFNILLVSTILASGLSATEHGGANHAAIVLADGIGFYTTVFNEYAKAIAYLNGKYGVDAFTEDESLKEYVINRKFIHYLKEVVFFYVYI